jgi:hypothetical protein
MSGVALVSVTLVFLTDEKILFMSGVALFSVTLVFLTDEKILFLHVKQPCPNIIRRSNAATNMWAHVDVFRNLALQNVSMTRFIRSLFADDST